MPLQLAAPRHSLDWIVESFAVQTVVTRPLGAIVMSGLEAGAPELPARLLSVVPPNVEEPAGLVIAWIVPLLTQIAPAAPFEAMTTLGELSGEAAGEIDAGVPLNVWAPAERIAARTVCVVASM